MEEAAFLNPASLSFFTVGDVYVQRDMIQFKDAAGKVVQKPKNTGVVLTDGNQSLSGSLSYVKQEEGVLSRKRWGLQTSSQLDTKNAFGVSFRKTKDENSLTGERVDYYQTVFGLTHALDQTTSLGLVAYDAFNSKGKATKAIIGVQHAFVDAITVSFDLGGNYNAEEISNSLLYRGSIQVRVLEDFFLRFGGFNDKEQEEKGNAFGLGWVTPRLGFEFALKQTKQKASPALARNETKMREASFGVSLRF
ncbi:MAG: hypothetical protein H7336_04770 [Bacteriovorax sp.]|nr:hypothetical protein [Bacteriovorax sp.]